MTEKETISQFMQRIADELAVNTEKQATVILSKINPTGVRFLAEELKGDIPKAKLKEEFHKISEIQNEYISVKNMEKLVQNYENQSIEGWFEGSIPDNRYTRIRICFALGMDEKETNEFLYDAFCEHEIDYHDCAEACMGFCLKNGLNYITALEMCKKVFQETETRSVDHRSLHTHYSSAALKSELCRIADDPSDLEKSKCEFVDYLIKNISSYDICNMRALSLIADLYFELTMNDEQREQRKKRLQKQHKSRSHYSPDYINLTNINKDAKKCGSSICAESLFGKWLEKNKINYKNKLLPQGMFNMFIGPQKRPSMEKVKIGSNLESKYIRNVFLGSYPSIDEIMKLFELSRDIPLKSGDTARPPVYSDSHKLRNILLLFIFLRFWIEKQVAGAEGNGWSGERKVSDREVFYKYANSYLYRSGYAALSTTDPFDRLMVGLSCCNDPIKMLKEIFAEPMIY